VSHEHLMSAGGVGLTVRHYRCRKGHEFTHDLLLTHYFGPGYSAQSCPTCWVEFIGRECGGVVEITGEPQPDHVAEAP
jgi:hypothetical protein